MEPDGFNPQRLLDDRNFVRNIVQNTLQVVDQAVPERKATVIQILKRQEELSRLQRRGGPTRHQLFDLQQFCPGEQQVPDAAAKGLIVGDILRRLRAVQPFPQPRNTEGAGIARPDGPAPAGWEPALPERPVPAARTALLRKRREENSNEAGDPCYGLDN